MSKLSNSEDKTTKREQSQGQQTERVRTLDRGLAILEVVAQGDNLPLTEIARRVDLALSTTYRLLETLKLRRFVQQSSVNNGYSVGLRAFEVGSHFVSHGQLPEVAHPVMQALVSAINESVNLAIQDGHEAIYVHQLEGNQKVRMFTRVGARAPLHCTGVGKALIAWKSKEHIRPLFEEVPLTAYTPHTLTTITLLEEELQATVKRGYARDREEYELGIQCAAAPIRDVTGNVVAAVSVSAPIQRFVSTRYEEVAKRLMEAGAEISARLGWTPSRSRY